MKLTVSGDKKLVAQLEVQKKAKGRKKCAGTVGYSAPYALPVHENLSAFHPNGQAKYLEQPARDNAKKYEKIVQQVMKQGMTVEQAVYTALLELQRDSMQLVPVRTGFLRSTCSVTEPT